MFFSCYRIHVNVKVWFIMRPSLFVCFGFMIPLENFLFVCRGHHYQWTTANFYLCSVLMAIEQWSILSVLHLLSHGVSVYNGNLRGLIRLTAVAERLAVELLQPFLKTYVCRGWDSNTQPLLAGPTL